MRSIRSDFWSMVNSAGCRIASGRCRPDSGPVHLHYKPRHDTDRLSTSAAFEPPGLDHFRGGRDIVGVAECRLGNAAGASPANLWRGWPRRRVLQGFGVVFLVSSFFSIVPSDFSVTVFSLDLTVPSLFTLLLSVRETVRSHPTKTKEAKTDAVAYIAILRF